MHMVNQAINTAVRIMTFQTPGRNVPITIMISPQTTEVIPANRWLFCQTVSFAILYVVRKPNNELRRAFGMIFPRTTSKIPVPIPINFMVSMLMVDAAAGS